MKTLNLETKKVTKGTVTEITNFVYENRAILGDEAKLFYGDVKGMIEIQLTKPAARRMTMSQVLERAFNIEFYIMQSGAVSYSVEFINVK